MSKQPPSPETAKSEGHSIYLTTRASGYQEENLQDEMLWAEFRDNFRDWIIADFNECPSMTLRKFRQLLRQRGVWVGSHPEIPPAQSLYDVVKEERRTKWSETDIQDFINDGGRFLSNGIAHFMLEHSMPTPPVLPPQVRVSSPSITFSQPISSLYSVLPTLPQGGTPSPTPTAQPGQTRHHFSNPRQNTTQGPSNDARTTNPLPTTNQPNPTLRQPNNWHNDNFRNESLNRHGLRDGPRNNTRQNDYRSGNRGNHEDEPREEFYNGIGHGTGYGFGNCLATLEKIYKDECKYSGRKDNFDHKLGIFFDLCLKANVPPNVRG